VLDARRRAEPEPAWFDGGHAAAQAS